MKQIVKENIKNTKFEGLMSYKAEWIGTGNKMPPKILDNKITQYEGMLKKASIMDRGF